MYNFYKINIDNEKLLKESLFDISKLVEKFLKESIIFVIIFNLLIAIKEKYEKNCEGNINIHWWYVR